MVTITLMNTTNGRKPDDTNNTIFLLLKSKNIKLVELVQGRAIFMKSSNKFRPPCKYLCLQKPEEHNFLETLLIISFFSLFLKLFISCFDFLLMRRHAIFNNKYWQLVCLFFFFFCCHYYLFI